jgi:hypothetical protein
MSTINSAPTLSAMSLKRFQSITGNTPMRRR